MTPLPANRLDLDVPANRVNAFTFTLLTYSLRYSYRLMRSHKF